MSETIVKPKKKHRLRRFFFGLLILILALGLAGFAYFSFVLRPGLSRQGKAIVANAMDYNASTLVQNRLAEAALDQGVEVFVYTLADEDRNIHSENGQVSFMHIEVNQIRTDVRLEDYMHGISRGLVLATEDGVDIRQTGFFIFDEGQALVSFIAPMESLRAWDQGTMTDEVFFEQVSVKVEDISQLQKVFEVYINDRIGEGLIRKLFGD